MVGPKYRPPPQPHRPTPHSNIRVTRCMMGLLAPSFVLQIIGEIATCSRLAAGEEYSTGGGHCLLDLRPILLLRGAGRSSHQVHSIDITQPGLPQPGAPPRAARSRAGAPRTAGL